MCTAVIYRNINKGFYGIGFNRDESYLRAGANVPNKYIDNNISAIYPTDGNFGGTWIGINQYNEIFALLNFYEVDTHHIKNSVSRGLLVKQLLHRQITLDDLSVPTLNKYHPFRLVTLSQEKTELLVWNGKEPKKEINIEPWFILGSSYTQGSKAEISRRKVFYEKFYKDNIEDKTDFYNISKKFLSCHEPSKSALSPCMHQFISHTVSQTIIIVDNGEPSFFYTDRQPCEKASF
jgi:uncharacterized protein with NRDE domain